MDKKYTIFAIILSLIIGFTFGYIICLYVNNTGIFNNIDKDVAITNPAAW